MAHEYHADIRWSRDGAVFTDNRFSRGHVWRFDEGLEIPASSSPLSVPPPLSVTRAVDPEEAFVAALSSCHMLFFLHLAAKQGFVVDSYQDAASGVMTKNEEGEFFVSKVILNPKIVFSGSKRPSAADVDDLHHRSHHHCYVANSVKSEIVLGSAAFSIV